MTNYKPKNAIVYSEDSIPDSATNLTLTYDSQRHYKTLFSAKSTHLFSPDPSESHSGSQKNRNSHPPADNFNEPFNLFLDILDHSAFSETESKLQTFPPKLTHLTIEGRTFDLPMDFLPPSLAHLSSVNP